LSDQSADYEGINADDLPGHMSHPGADNVINPDTGTSDDL